MPKVSNRGVKMPSSPIRKLTPFAESAEKKGVKVYHLNIGQPDIKSPKAALQAVKDNQLERLPYSSSQGNESYRLKLVEYYKRNQIRLDASDILVTNGGSEAVHFAFLSCLDPGDEVLVPEPFYANYSGFATMTNVTIKPVTSSIETGFALPEIDKIRSAITARTKAVFICNPNNPTGYVYTRKELEQLKDICKEYGLFLFSDEAYREFCYESQHISVLQLEGLDENAIVIDTISKRYSACGGRLGALITRNKKVYEVALKFAQSRLSPPTYAQIFAEAAVDAPQSYFDEVKEEYKERRDLLVGRLKKMEGVECYFPSGAFYALAKLPVDNAEEFCKWLLKDFSFDNSTVMLAPASGFYLTPGLGLQEVRLAYVINKRELNKGLDCLEEALKVYPFKISKRKEEVVRL